MSIYTGIFDLSLDTIDLDKPEEQINEINVKY